MYVGKLGKILHCKLAKHIRTKIDDPTKHNHPAILFVKATLNRFAALLYFYDQARFSSVLNSKSTILKDPDEGGFLLAIDEEAEGSYLHYWRNGKKFVRSGEAVGNNNSHPLNGIVRRNEVGHKKKAKSSSLVDGE